MDVKICKEVALGQVNQFKKAWGMYDAKTVISGGKESSVPEEVSDLFLANVMTGDIEFKDDGRTVIQRLSTPVDDLQELVFKNKIKVHHLREVQSVEEADQPLKIALACTSANAGQLSELTSRDNAVLTAITVYISFS